MDRAQKQAFIDGLAGKLAGAQCVYVTDFTGLDVERMTELRSKLRGSSVDYVVVKNTLAKRALAGTFAEPLEAMLEGPTAFAVSQADAVAAAKALTDFAKDTDMPRLKGGVVAGRILSVGEIRRLAALPGRQVLLAQLAGSLRSPVSGLVFVLAGVLAKLVRTVDALGAQKAEQGEPSPPAEGPAESPSPAGAAAPRGEAAAPAAGAAGGTAQPASEVAGASAAQSEGAGAPASEPGEASAAEPGGPEAIEPGAGGGESAAAGPPPGESQP